MKKLLLTILAFVYLSTSMGTTIHLHYCMGKLFSWSLVDKDSGNCGECGMPKSKMGGHCMSFKDGCCRDSEAHLQLDKDQNTTEAANTFSAFPFAVLPVASTILHENHVVADITGYPTTNSPPEPDKVPVFIRNCIFRI